MDTSSEIQRFITELGLQSYSRVDLMSFTSNFTESIGSGGCGKVYKGQLPKGILIAIKVLEDVVEDTFMAEVSTMGKARHLNLIKLYGYCFEKKMKALVYEFMVNGSLDKILYENHHSNIEWVKLYDIAIGIANGLKYLHHDLEEQIIHYDIKPANVLLGENFSAKLADFGLAKTMKRYVSRVDVSRIRGTYGYMAPEIYNQGFQASRKCDVYSFGMMLFEILGKRSNGVGQNWFPRSVWNKFESGNLEHYITTYCGIVEMNKENANILCKVALWCVQENPDQRPSMKDVVLMLEKEKLVENPPLPSSYFRGQSDEMELCSTDRQNIIARPPYASVAGCEGRVILRQLKSNKRKTLSPDREWSDEMELDPTHPKNIIAGPSHASVAGSEDRVTLPQLNSNNRKTWSPNRKEDLATSKPNKGLKLPTTKLVGKTPLKYKEAILELIAKDEALTIGVYGMGGVGKTHIFKKVYNQLLVEPNRFDKIIWVVVSKVIDFKKLQNDIAKELDLDLSGEDDVDRRSRLLLQAVEKWKRVLFFFDDMWKEISLEKIGIPEPTQENGFKIILTTRLLDVCRRMGCHKDNIIKVEVLPKYEAWELLMYKIDCVLTPEVEEIVEMVAKKCFGLPLAIIIVGGAMRENCDKNDWTVALNDLNLKDPSNRTMSMEDDLFKCLKFSYDRLENEKQRKCFLFCALYPEDWDILPRDLVDFWIMDGLVEGRNRQDELVKGQCILNKLKGHCLLETVDEIYDAEYNETSYGVKLHDSIRDMALRLTNKCFMVNNDPDLKELPNEEEWEIDLEKASFMKISIKAVSISPICPNLSTIIIRGNSLERVTHDFFVHMKSLKILDLQFSGSYYMESLPNSISDLVNLGVLRLHLSASPDHTFPHRYSRLKKLPALAKLVYLRTLDLNRTGIEELPKGIETLVNLRCLNLQEAQLKERIPIGLISKFTLMQELYLGGINVDKLYDVGRSEYFAKELLSLKHLENLSVTFHCLSDYVGYVGSPKFSGLKCFFLATGEAFYPNRDYVGGPSRATIKLVDPSDEPTSFFILPNTKRLEVEAFDDVIRLNEFGWLIKDVEKLVSFTIGCCKNLECIWSSKEFSATGTSSTCWLRRLEVIKIDECTKLYTIFEGIPNYTFGDLPVFCLKWLLIYGCQNLKKVFPSPRLLQLLPNLERFRIESCNELKELIGDDENEETETPIVIPRLKDLLIFGLPKLKRICRGAIICDSLKFVFVLGCYELKKLPRIMGVEQSTPPPALRLISDNKWWDSLEWDPLYTKSILQPFFQNCCVTRW